MDWREEERKERRLLLLVWRTGYYTFLNTHIHHAGAHHLNEVILVFLIRLIINYLDVNCFAVDGKIKYHKQRGRIGARQLEKKQEEKERERDPERFKLALVPQGHGRRWLSWPFSSLSEFSWASCGCML